MKKRKTSKVSSLKLSRRSVGKKDRNLFLWVGLILLVLGGLVYYLIAINPAKSPQAAVRDMYQWPFDKTSPWNMPVGSNAQLTPANLGTPSGYFTENEYIYLDPNAPTRTLRDNGKWPATCGGGSDKGQVRIPDGVKIEQGSSSYQPNNAAGAIKSDNNNVQEFLYASRCDGVGDVYTGLTMCSYSLTGSGGIGQYCGHGGSGLSAVGGSLRAWERATGTPIRHALKLTLPAPTLNNDGDSAECKDGWRWPAIMADNGWNEGGGRSEYSGAVKDLCMGSLLVIPPSTNCQTLVSGELERRVCQAMQDYGAYVVDIHPYDGYWRPFAINGEPGANLNEGQMTTIFQNLSVVKNSSASNVGGGGTPRVALAPDFGTNISSPTPAPTPPQATQQPVVVTPSPVATPSPAPSPTQQPSVSSSLEAENMVIRSGYQFPSTNVFGDTAASGGKGLWLLSNGYADGQIAGPFSSVIVRARPDLCEGAPSMTVRVDGNVALTSTVATNSWVEYRAPYTAGAGNHTVRIDFTNDLNPGTCDRNLRLDVIKASNVAPTTAPTTAPTPAPTVAPTSTLQPIVGVLKGDFFNNKTLTGTPVVTISTQRINYDWGTTGQPAGINRDNFSARFTGRVNFDGSTYRFNATVDDGVRIKIDGQTVIESWKDQAPTTYNALFKPTKGDHDVVVEFYESLNTAVLQANWVSHTGSCYDLSGDGAVTAYDQEVLGDHYGTKGDSPWNIQKSSWYTALFTKETVNTGDQGKLASKLGTTC